MCQEPRRVRNQIFHNNGDRVVKSAQVQSCRYTGIYTQPLLQGLTPALPHSLGEYQGRKVQLLSGFPAHPSHTDLVYEEHVVSWEFTLTCWWIPHNRNKWQLSRQLQDLAGPWDVGIVLLDHACWKRKNKIMSLQGRFLWANQSDRTRWQTWIGILGGSSEGP